MNSKQSWEAKSPIDPGYMERRNPTIMNEPGYDLAGPFLAEHDIEVLASLPPPQEALEGDYKRRLAAESGDYMTLLKNAYQREKLNGVVCRSLLSVDYRGYLYDCDFNQMLGLPLEGNQQATHLDDLLDKGQLPRRIGTADHCYGCTAGQGSSCGGALA